MSRNDDSRRCAACGVVLPEPTAPGRPHTYCAECGAARRRQIAAAWYRERCARDPEFRARQNAGRAARRAKTALSD